MHASKIIEALRERRLLRFRYKDHLTSTTVEPYTFGDFPNGHSMQSAWLISGETNDPRPPLWRLYLVDEMNRVEVLADQFEQNRPDYNPNDSRFHLIRGGVSTPRSSAGDRSG
jgi:hypothetical protein